MAGIDKNHQPGHHALTKWADVTNQIRAFMAVRQAHPSHVVVLVPYAQLIHELRSAWLASVPSEAIGFTPQFQSTMNWAKCLGASVCGNDDLQMSPGLDALNARLWIDRAGLSAHGPMLVPFLVDTAHSLVPLAAALDPVQRLGWSTRMAAHLAVGAAHEAFAFETAIAQLALTWVGHSVFPTDVLFASPPVLLVVLRGFQDDPLVRALALRAGENCLQIALHDLNSDLLDIRSDAIALYPALDAQDEAELACACVLRHLANGRQPVALVAVDRLLTRRVHAMLNSRGVVIRDETGWKLSTTRAAAAVAGLLKACKQFPSSDEVLDWLKNAPAFSGTSVQLTESFLRRQNLGQWPDGADVKALRQTIPDMLFDFVQAVNTIRGDFSRGRSLKDWLISLQDALQASGQWAAMEADQAGQAVNKALMLEPVQRVPRDSPALAVEMRFAEFANWVNQTLEAANFLPVHPAGAQVIILPLSQLLGRPLPAVVLAGCDEVRLPLRPEPVGPWTPAQRETLGLSSSDALAQAQRAAWHYALKAPRIDLLWRNSEAGEPVLPNGYVQELLLQPALLNAARAPDPRVSRRLTQTPIPVATVQSAKLPVLRLSATAYNDLRQCPYRFFALRQLDLAPVEELEGSLDKRDFGNWLHRVLFHFHTSYRFDNLEPGDLQAASQVRQIDLAAATATRELALSEAEFLPFSASWPQVRKGYLQWFGNPQNQMFSEGEVWQELQLGQVRLVGKLDRIDRLPDGQLRLLDYKTEPQEVTHKRIKAGTEDTQLPFYAALFDVQAIQGAYVNVGERDGTETFVQPELVALRDQLAQGILDDMQRLQLGHPLVAMGQGSACDYCSARGLCRKDMVSPSR